MSTRERAPNYSNEEKMLLFNIIDDYKHIIECKKTDTVTWKDKETAWIKITKQFNALCPNYVQRTKNSVQKFYENSKKKLKKEVAANKRQILKTGGGVPDLKKVEPANEMLLNIVNKNTIYGLNNRFDADADNMECNDPEVQTIQLTKNIRYKQMTSKDKNIEFVFDDIETGEIDNQSDIEEKTKDANEDVTQYQIEKPSESEHTDWGNYKASNLKTPLSKKLQNKKTDETWTQRRRPPLTMHSSHLSKQYGDLAIVKLELATLQRDAFIEDRKNRQQQEQIEFDLRKRSLEYDIEIKKAQLKKLLIK